MAKLNIRTALHEREDRIKSEDNSIVKEEKNKFKELKVKMIEEYGMLVHLNESILNQIDFNDKKFINRLYDNIDDLKNEDLDGLKESIKEIGLMNIVYLQEKKGKNGKDFLIVSGLRRLLSIRQLVEEGIKVREMDRLIIFKENTPLEFLEKISIDENTKRVNLSILEEAYKIDKYARKNGKTMEETSDYFKISRKQATRLRGALNYPKELKDLLDKIGIRKADLLNKIIKIQSKDKELIKILEENKDRKLDELEDELRILKKKSLEKFIWKTNKANNKTIIEIKGKVTTELELLIKQFKEKVNEIIK